MSAPPLPSTPSSAGGTPRATEVVGNTPVVWIDRPVHRRRTRLLGQARRAPTPAASRTARPCTWSGGPANAVTSAPAAGSSSRPAARSASAWPWPGMVYGHPVTLVTDPGMEPLMYRLLRAYGARGRIVAAAAADGGWQQARRERVAPTARRRSRLLVPGPVQQPRQRRRLRAAGPRTAAQLGPHRRPGVQRRHRRALRRGLPRRCAEHLPDLRLVGVDTIGSTIFGQPARPG